MAHVNLGACLFRRRVFDVVGPFDERLLHYEDVDLMFRVRIPRCELSLSPTAAKRPPATAVLRRSQR